VNLLSLLTCTIGGPTCKLTSILTIPPWKGKLALTPWNPLPIPDFQTINNSFAQTVANSQPDSLVSIAAMKMRVFMNWTKAQRRRKLVTPALLRRMGIEPIEVNPLSQDSALTMAGIKLSFAAILKRHLNKSRKRDMISGFNCSRPDGSPVVKGCSKDVWQANYERALSEALAYLEMGRVKELEGSQ
jgi:hypothetical protein